MKVYGVIGWKNAGKTSLMERLVASITAKGFTVSTVKHVHHDVDLDEPGKDTYRHRIAGASEVVLASSHRFALMREHRGPEPALTDILARMAPVDLVLVEGYKRDAHPKIEVFRHATGQALIQPGDPLIRAVATDATLSPLTVPVLDLNDTETVAQFILTETGLQKTQLGAAMFDEVMMVDWSASSAPASKDAENSIWLRVEARNGSQSLHFRTRAEAEDWITFRLKANSSDGMRTLAGFDFAFGYPHGFARRLTGRADAKAVWSYFNTRLQTGPRNANLRFELAGMINRQFSEPGPFWGCAREDSVEGLPYRKTPTYGASFLSEKRRVEAEARGTKSVWQLSGAGAVGSQSLVGLPMIHRLVDATGAKVWPFDPPTGPTVLAEVYPSLLAKIVNKLLASEAVDGKKPKRDEIQVRLLAQAFWALAQTGEIADLFNIQLDATTQEEGWILGAGHVAALERSLR